MIYLFFYNNICIFKFLDWNEDDCNRELKNCEEKLEDITNQFDILKEMLVNSHQYIIVILFKLIIST